MSICPYLKFTVIVGIHVLVNKLEVFLMKVRAPNFWLFGIETILLLTLSC